MEKKPVATNKKKLIIILVAVLVLVAAIVTGVILANKKEPITIAVPNDATNEGRALLLLQGAGIIKLDEKAGITATVKDIVERAKGGVVLKDRVRPAAMSKKAKAKAAAEAEAKAAAEAEAKAAAEAAAAEAEAPAEA